MKSYTGIAALLLMVLLPGCSEDAVDAVLRGSIEGTVSDRDTGEPLEGAVIKTNPASTTATTDAEGMFLLENIEVDDYSVQADLEGYSTTFEPVSVLNGETAQALLEMEVEPESNIPPSTPTLLTPEDGAIDVPRMVDLVWSSSATDSDDITYTVQLRNGTTNEMESTEVVVDTMLTVEDLVLGTNYFWQVSASDGTSDAVESSISSFTVITGNDNRFFYTRNVDGNNVIFSGTDTEDDDMEVNENELQVTSASENSFRPRRDVTAGKVAFLRTSGANTHIFTMNPDGTDITQITNTVPVAGFRLDELDFTWYDNGSKLYYPNFNRLYSINRDGTGNELVYEVQEGTFISEVAVNEGNDQILLKTNDANGYNARIFIILVDGSGLELIVSGLPGALGGIDFSIDGNKVLYTRDVSGFENSEYRILDSRIFEYDRITFETIEIDTDKPPGTNDLDPKYSPDGGTVIFVNASNDGISPSDIYTTVLDNLGFTELQFTDAYMPDWQ